MWAQLLTLSAVAFTPSTMLPRNALAVDRVRTPMMAGWNDPYEVRGSTKRAGALRNEENDFDALMAKQEKEQIKIWFGGFGALTVVFLGYLFVQIQAL